MTYWSKAAHKSRGLLGCGNWKTPEFADACGLEEVQGYGWHLVHISHDY